LFKLPKSNISADLNNDQGGFGTWCSAFDCNFLLEATADAIFSSPEHTSSGAHPAMPKTPWVSNNLYDVSPFVKISCYKDNNQYL
jgi:hypothetical protein